MKTRKNRAPVRRITESQLRRIIRQEVRRSQKLRENYGNYDGMMEAEDAESQLFLMAKNFISGKSPAINKDKLDDVLSVMERERGVDADDLYELVSSAGTALGLGDEREDRDAVEEFYSAVDEWLVRNIGSRRGRR